LLLSAFVTVAATHPDAHSRDLNTDPWLSVLLRTFLVALSLRLMMSVLLNNHGGSIMMAFLVVLSARLMMMVLNNYEGSVMIDLRNAIGSGCCLGRASKQAGSGSQKRKRKFVHIHSSLVCPCAFVANDVHYRVHHHDLVFGYDGRARVACELHAEHDPACGGVVN
jgi:hypothetical protein